MKKLIAILALLAPIFVHAEYMAEHEQWRKQRVITSDFSFEVLLDEVDEDRFAVQAIKIFSRRTGTIFQEIQVIGASDVSARPDAMIRIVDANFDGRPDIEIPFSNGGAGPNFFNQYYIFDRESNRFKLDQQLSNLSQPSISQNGTITSSSRDGCCRHTSETYRVRKGKLVLIHKWAEESSPDGKWIVTTEQKLRRGMWRTDIKRTPAEEGN